MALPPKRRLIFYGDYFHDFYANQSLKVRAKIDWTLELVMYLRVVPEQYLKHIVGTTLYEVRVAHGGNAYRILCFFERDELIVLLTGFQKKSQKTPRNEIDKAIELQKQYRYENKIQDHNA